MSRLLALSGETVKITGGDGEDRIFTITAFDPVAGRYVGLGHRSTTDPVGQLPLPVITAHVEGTDFLSVFLVADPGPHPLLGPITVHNQFGVCGPLKRRPRQGLMWTANAQEGLAYIISSGFADISAPSVDVLPVAVPIEITKTTNGRWNGGGSQFIFKGTHLKGMSGSPIIQNGCIVGAHFGVNPSDKTGVGVHIDQMLDGLYREADAKMGKPRNSKGMKVIRATHQQIRTVARMKDADAAALRRVQGGIFYCKSLMAYEPKYQALRSQLAAYEAGRISKGILFERQKRTYPEALKLLWDYEQARLGAAMRSWETPGMTLTREQRTALERCLRFEV